MLRKLYSIAALFSVIHMAVLLGLGGYAFATGKVDRQTIEQLASVVRGDEATTGEDGEDGAYPESGSMDPAQSSEAKIKAMIEAQEIERLKADRMRVDLQRQESMIDRRTLRLQQEMNHFEKHVAAYDARLETEREQQLSESFGQLVKTISGLKPKNALASLMTRSHAESVRILLDMSPRKRNQIMDACRGTSEIEWRNAMFDAMLQRSAQGTPDTPRQGGS